ncbi:hypothetical protein MIND_01341300 [Mycena indigotica]|uniref:DUF6534 domain-containing protein n=1 Tax=Mycena indigotica TaxID=2126181 RepID=A0A8H6S2U1_9AGAR|nr:uncharacterized protein MIND_01341300 [Mycena indigotica]KAF7290275.1 hypothetical protein MIND_01341300 [Mycena indigotica]
MSLSALQGLFAPALIGTWVNAMAYMLELVLAWRYYTSRHLYSPGANTTLVRWIVSVQLGVDTLGTMVNAAAVYLVLVRHWGELPYLANNTWAGAAYCITTGISGYLEQLYLIWRYGILSKNYLVCIVLALSATASVGGAIGLGALTFLHPAVTERQRIVPVSLVWFITATVADIAIACALVFQLRKYKSAFKQTRHVVRQLILAAAQTGSITALVTTLTLIAFAAWPQTAITLAFGFFLGRVYGCTLLYNVVSRRVGGMGDSTDMDEERVSGSRQATSGGRDRMERATVLETLGGIHVHQIVQVTKDADIDIRRLTPDADDIVYADSIIMQDHKAPAIGRGL